MGKKGRSLGKNKSHYRKSGHNYSKQGKMLQSGMSGVLMTCSGIPSQCVREAYNLLNEYGEKIYGPEEVTKGDIQDADDDGNDSEEDIAESLQKEVDALKAQGSNKDRRFKNVLTGAKNVIFIQTKGVDPHKIVKTILTDLEETKTLKGRYIQRMLPVSHTCKAQEDRIEKTAQEMLYPAFHSPDAVDSTFCIQFKARNNSQIKKDPIVQLLAPMVTQGSIHVHRVDFDNPDQTLAVDIIGGVCCLSVLEGYRRFKRYNLHLVAKGDGDAVDKGDKDPVAMVDEDLVAKDNADLVGNDNRDPGDQCDQGLVAEADGGSEENGWKRKRGNSAGGCEGDADGSEAKEVELNPSGGKKAKLEDQSNVTTTTTTDSCAGGVVMSEAIDTGDPMQGDASITSGSDTQSSCTNATTSGIATSSSSSANSDTVSTSHSAAATGSAATCGSVTSESVTTTCCASTTAAGTADRTGNVSSSESEAAIQGNADCVATSSETVSATVDSAVTSSSATGGTAKGVTVPDVDTTAQNNADCVTASDTATNQDESESR